MLKRYLFFLATACIFQSSYVSSLGSSGLDRVLTLTTEFFEQLRLNYESQPVTPELYELIDKEVEEYVKKVKKSSTSSRGKRQLDLDNEIGVLNGFESVPGLHIPDALDVSFFVRHSGAELRWYAATLNSLGVTLLQYKDRIFIPVGFYKLENGTRVISHSSCEEATLLVVQRSVGDALVLRLSKENDVQVLHKVQTLDTPDASHSTLWRGMKKIYLAVASPRNLTVFTWLGEHFDHIQAENLGAKRLVPFLTGGSMHLVAINEPQTFVLKYLLRSSEFVVVQKLVSAEDGTAFHLEKGHLGEHFLALTGKRSTVIYKQTRHRFVPFQELPAAQEIHSLTHDAAVLLLLIKNREIVIHQYDGWKFVESGVRYSGIVDALPVSLQDEQILALRIEDSTLNNGLSTNRGINANGMISQTNISYDKNVRPSGVEEDRLGSGMWSFRRIIWRKRKSWKSLREDTKIWCRDSLQKVLRVPATVPELKGSIRIERGHIKNLRVYEVNGHSAKKFATLTERWKKISSETSEQQSAIKGYISTVNPVFKNLRADDVRVNCTTKCHAAKVEAAVKGEFLKRLRVLDDANQNLDFRNVKVSFAKNLPCPVPAPKLEEATVSGLVNGISFRSFVQDVMRLTGDQLLNGTYTFAKLHVKNAKIPLDVASNYTRQDIVADTIEVEELNVTAGGLLLPLNGGSSVLTGSLTVPTARIEGLVHLRGGIRGSGAKVLTPMIHVTEPLELTKNVSLRNVKIVETLKATDLTRSTGKSFNEIIANALPLNSGHVPVHFNFRNDKVSWKNMTLRNFPYKWVTKKYPSQGLITGMKYATNPTLMVGQLAYRNLPTPRLPVRLCSMNVISEGIWESNLVIDRGMAKSVRSMNVFEESELAELYSDAATTFEEIPWELKNLTGRVTVKKANVGLITGMDYEGLKKSMGRWIEPGHLKGSLKVPDLKVHDLLTRLNNAFLVSLPQEVGNVVSQQNIYIDKLNDIDFNQFLKSIVKLEDSISLTNVTFAGGFDAKDVFATKTSFSLQENLTSGYLGSKEILGTLESDAMVVPNVFDFTSENGPVNIIANGNVRFEKEPKITNVNNKNLERLYTEVWLTDRATVAFADSIEFENAGFENVFTLLKSFNTPNLGPWADLENRLLSKTKPQTISVSASFNSIGVPNVIGAAKSRLRSNVSYLQDLEDNTLKKNSTQVIKNNWNFEELVVTGNLDVRGRVNGLNLATDVVRNDVERNVITGKKIVDDLTARNIDGLKFGKFASNALRRNNGNRTIVVKGWKTFDTLEMKDARVEGKIMGRTVENVLLKSSTQNLRGKKLFRGTLTAPAVLTNGTVNGVNLKYMIEYQLKKRAPLQIVKSPMMLANSLTILGNVTIDGLYHGVDLRNFKSAESSFLSLVNEASEVMHFAEGIDVALANRAVYWDKLELLEENSTPLTPDPDKDELLELSGLGSCRIRGSSLYCNDQKVFDALSAAPNGSRVLHAKVLALSGIPLVASVTSDPLGGASIFRYNIEEKQFHRIAGLHIPGIVEGSITTMTDSLWMSLRLPSHTMILRYELWADFQQWVLPGGGPFLMSSAPTEELLIFRSDGVWRLGGLAGPRLVFPVTLNGQIDTFSFGSDYYVQLSDKNVTTLLKTRYIGN